MNLAKECEPVTLSSEQLISDFDCGNDDLNDFFNHDAIKYQEQMMCQTYFFRHNETGKVVCAFSLSIVFTTDEQERGYYKRPDTSDPLRTRFLFYDMIKQKNNSVG